LALAAATGATAPPAGNIAIPAPTEILSTLHPGHPRLLATSNDFVQLKQRVSSETQLRAWHDALRREAENLITQPPSKYEIPDDLRLLSVSRRVLHRTQLLALLHRLDGDPRWRDRAWKELEAAAQFPDWNPRHFLDTAEMTHAFALGYDWLFEAWTPEQRATVRAAMIEKGMKPALEIHRKKTGWTRARHNWNQVCNGGIGIGALALAEVEPQLAGEFLHGALNSIQLPMAEYAPDGAWAEGPAYWNYATTYNAAPTSLRPTRSTLKASAVASHCWTVSISSCRTKSGPTLPSLPGGSCTRQPGSTSPAMVAVRRSSKAARHCGPNFSPHRRQRSKPGQPHRCRVHRTPSDKTATKASAS
jgi:hypothetical protein